MPVVDKYEALDKAFGAAAAIYEHATFLRNYGQPIPFNILRSRMSSMSEMSNGSIKPLLALGTEAQVNAVIATFFVGLAGSPLPASPYAQFQAVVNALNAFNAAYDPIHDTIEHVTFDPVTGLFSYASIPLGQFATLADELDALIAAVSPLR